MARWAEREVWRDMEVREKANVGAFISRERQNKFLK